MPSDHKEKKKKKDKRKEKEQVSKLFFTDLNLTNFFRVCILKRRMSDLRNETSHLSRPKLRIDLELQSISKSIF